mmetsp:Transcript_33938/g.85813  ORF Transcript_33938/g.85813 Transcript_33938/m.85813 type:complete len:541 (-) Transcript_33938:74-1696(-)
MLREAQDAVFAEEGALLELRKDAVLVVEDDLDGPLDEKKHGVAVLPRLVEEVAGGERLGLEPQDDVSEELLSAVAEEGDGCDEVIVEVEGDLCPECEGELLDRCGDVAAVVVPVFKECARAKAEVQGKVFLVHKVVQVLHPLLEGARPDVHLSQQGSHVADDDSKDGGPDCHHDDAKDELGCRLHGDVAVADRREGGEGDVERNEVLDERQRLLEVVLPPLRVLVPALGDVAPHAAAHHLLEPGGRVGGNDLLPVCTLHDRYRGALEDVEARPRDDDGDLGRPVDGELVLPVDDSIEEAREKVGEDKDNQDKLEEPQVPGVDRQRVLGLGDEPPPPRQARQADELEEAGEAREPVEAEGLEGREGALAVHDHVLDDLDGEGPHDVEPEPPLEVRLCDDPPVADELHGDEVVGGGVDDGGAEVEEYVDPEAAVHAPQQHQRPVVDRRVVRGAHHVLEREGVGDEERGVDEEEDDPDVPRQPRARVGVEDKRHVRHEAARPPLLLRRRRRLRPVGGLDLRRLDLERRLARSQQARPPHGVRR